MDAIIALNFIGFWVLNKNEGEGLFRNVYTLLGGGSLAVQKTANRLMK